VLGADAMKTTIRAAAECVRGNGNVDGGSFRGAAGFSGGEDSPELYPKPSQLPFAIQLGTLYRTRFISGWPARGGSLHPLEGR
jgi:hypothetical protein